MIIDLAKWKKLIHCCCGLALPTPPLPAATRPGQVVLVDDGDIGTPLCGLVTKVQCDVNAGS
jgi:hypothetical protein